MDYEKIGGRQMRIGGHLGMDVERLENGVVRKTALHVKDNGTMTGEVGVDLFDHNRQALRNEWKMLDLMIDSGFTADPLRFQADFDMIEQSDLGDQMAPVDMELWRQNCVRAVATIRAKGARHGDLKGNNIITVDDWPWIVDWQESHLLSEKAPQKSPYTDSYLMFTNVKNMPGPDGQYDTPRVARRWLAVLGGLQATKHSDEIPLRLKDKTFLDLGCFQGDFVAMAATEGMIATGVDFGGFRHGENSIEIGDDVWKDFPPLGAMILWQINILNVSNFAHDVVMMFSTWPYIVRDYGRDNAIRIIEKIMQQCGVLFFESQLDGDGPGPDFFQGDSDIERFLEEYGRVEHLARIPVTGRPAERSVWKVTPR